MAQRAPSAWRTLDRKHPEWWVLAIAAAAWLWIAAATGAGEHVHASAGIGRPIANWMAMTAAMMFPLVASQLRAAAARSLWRRRHRAIALFLLGYGSAWLVVGVAVVELSAVLPAVSSPLAVSLMFVAALVWQRSTIYRHAVRACHREYPLAPSGWKANIDSAHYGWRVGVSCAITCWPLMTACALAHHDLTVMILAATVTTVSRIDPRAWPIVLRQLFIEKAFR